MNLSEKFSCLKFISEEYNNEIKQKEEKLISCIKMINEGFDNKEYGKEILKAFVVSMNYNKYVKVEYWEDIDSWDTEKIHNELKGMANYYYIMLCKLLKLDILKKIIEYAEILARIQEHLHKK